MMKADRVKKWGEHFDEKLGSRRLPLDIFLFLFLLIGRQKIDMA